ncbi:GTPase-activating protein [Nowakowskiella sp. JEL0407]|nr:GTPase-activating protein [Nowakowskiella sp. JEL0407]
MSQATIIRYFVSPRADPPIFLALGVAGYFLSEHDTRMPYDARLLPLLRRKLDRVLRNKEFTIQESTDELTKIMDEVKILSPVSITSNTVVAPAIHSNNEIESNSTSQTYANEASLTPASSTNNNSRDPLLQDEEINSGDIVHATKPETISQNENSQESNSITHPISDPAINLSSAENGQNESYSNLSKRKSQSRPTSLHISKGSISNLPPWSRKTKKSVILSEDGDVQYVNSILHEKDMSGSPTSTKTPTTPIQRPPSPRKRHTSSNSVLDSDDIANEESASFLLARLEAQSKSSIYQTITNGLFGGFNTAKDGFQKIDVEEVVDWDFWGKLMQNYHQVALKDAKRLTRKLHSGIPPAIRGTIWLLMCKGKDPTLEFTFTTLLTQTSTHEKLIQRDLARTFPKHEYFMEKTGQESLYNVVKAYSLYDPEIGYCQGISFIVGPLLLNMPEEEAFCCCVRLMKDYNFRELFSPRLTGLQTFLYQYDKLMEDLMPSVHKHLEDEGIISSMYASQWFMTCFAYRFPLDIVFRIYDIVFAEGIEAMLRFGFALLKRNQVQLLTLSFEPLLNFLKIGLFDPYLENVTQLIHDASNIRLPKSKLDKLAQEYKEILEKSGPEFLEKEELRNENRRLRERLRRMDEAYEQLNREHIGLANELISAQIARERAVEKIEELEEQVEGLKDVVKTERLNVEMELRDHMQLLAQKNLELTTHNAELQEGNDQLERMLTATKMRHAECENERQEIIQRHNDLVLEFERRRLLKETETIKRSTSPDPEDLSDSEMAHPTVRPISSRWSLFGQIFKSGSGSTQV